MAKTFYVYIMSNRKKTLYVGVTSNLQRRVYQHKNHILKGFAGRYNLERLVYFETGASAISAIAREKQLKGWIRAKKLALIESTNPGWKDLAEEWLPIPSERTCAPITLCHPEAPCEADPPKDLGVKQSSWTTRSFPCRPSHEKAQDDA